MNFFTITIFLWTFTEKKTNKLLIILLFLGIVSDLFPGLIEKPVDYGILEADIRKSIRQMGLEAVNGKFSLSFITRVSSFESMY